MRNNPWLGLATYDEESIKQGYKFCGRKRATKELYSVVENNIITTLYGKSGIGKSSLLQAGLFPPFRANNYLPVMIRLGIGEINDGYCETIISAIKSAIASTGGRCCGTPPPPSSDEEKLWNFFHHTEFRNSRDEVVFPIIVLDQFEELYFRDRHHLNTLLKAIYLLVDDTMLATTGNDDEEENIINYRIVISIREDDLFHIEESIDKLRLVEMKNNRYRLRELSDMEARDIILHPREGLFSPKESEAIADTIIAKAKGENDEISTAILSLICSRIYDTCKIEGCIAFGAVNSFFRTAEGNFLKSFYDDIIKELRSPAKWYYIEDALVTDEGRRDSVPKSEFEKRIPDADFLFRGEKSMLRYVTLPGNNEPRVEIIHDTLARQLLNSKTERKLQQQAAALRKQRLTAAAIILVILAIGAAFFAQYRSIVEERNRLYKMQSLYITEKAEKLMGQGDNITAIRLLLNILPKKLNNPNRPYIEKAEFALRKAHELGCNFKSILNHRYYITSASFSPNGKYIVTASNDNTAKIWDAETGKQVGETMRHYYPVNSASFSPDGKFIVTASRDMRAKIWDAETGKQVGETMKHDDEVNSASFSPDGKFIVTASSDMRAKIWDAETGEEVAEIGGNDGPVSPASFSPDGKYIVTAAFDYTAKIWETETGKHVGETMKHADKVNSASFSPNGEYIVTISDDRTKINIWNTKTGEQVGETISHDGDVNSVSFSHDGKYFVAASNDHTAKIWKIETGEQIGETMKHDKNVNSASFSNDGKFIITASNDYTTKIWDAKTGEKIRETAKQNNSFRSASFSPDGKYIITIFNYKKYAIIWNIEEKIEESIIVNTLDDSIPDISNTKTIKHIIENIKHRPKCIEDANSIDYSKDGKFILTTSDDNTAKIWNAKTGEQVGETMMHDDDVNYASFSPNGKYIVTASDDNTAKIWDTETRKQVGETMKHEGGVNSVSFSHDGELIVTASRDNTAKIWNAKTGKQVGETMKHDSDVNSASFSNDGKYIVTTLFDKTAIIWNIKTGEPVGEIMRHNLLIESSSYSKDGKYIITASSNNNVKITERISSQDLLDKYNKLFEDWPLSEEELIEYNFK